MTIWNLPVIHTKFLWTTLVGNKSAKSASLIEIPATLKAYIVPGDVSTWAKIIIHKLTRICTKFMHPHSNRLGGKKNYGNLQIENH